MITLKKINNIGFFDVNQIEENIFIFNNFFNKNILDEIVKELSNISEAEWFKNSISGEWEGKFYTLKNKILIDKIKKRINKLCFLEDGLLNFGGDKILRQKPGQKMTAHIDGEGGPEEKFYRRWAIIIYLNDDYNNGEINFLEKQILIKPKKNSLLLFRTLEEYIHEVKPVTGDKIRYCMPLFLFKNKH